MTNRQWLESLSDEEFVDKLFYLFVTSGICEHVPDKECDEYYGCQECRLVFGALVHFLERFVFVLSTPEGGH